MTKEELIENAKIIVKKNKYKRLPGEGVNCTTYGVKCSKCPASGKIRGVNDMDSCGDLHSNKRPLVEWFEEYIENNCATKKPKKRSQKLNKREKLEARLSQVEETTRNAFRFAPNGAMLAVFNSEGEYQMVANMTPEEAVVFAKWVLDLEGGK